MQTRRSRYFPLALFGWTFWLPMAFAGTLLGGTLLVIPGGWPLAGLAGIVTIAGLLFFRDPIRRVPTDRAIMVAPADGKVTEITYLEHYEPLGASQGSVLRIGIFLSVLDVHINRAPCDAVVVATTYQEGLFLDARHPDSGPKNQSHTLVLGSTEAGDHHPIAVVKQIVGAIARRIIAPVHVGQHFSRGERFGMIAFGSRTELYVPHPDRWEVAVHIGQHVKAGASVLLRPKE